MAPPKRPTKPSKRPSAPPVFEGTPEPVIPPPPPTKPEGVGISIEPEEPEPGGAEDYYKRIHGHRTVLAMRAIKREEPMATLVDDAPEPPGGAITLLARVFAAEKEVAGLRERLAEALHERDAARGQVIILTERARLAREALDR
jgi:hypothetical protein